MLVNICSYLKFRYLLYFFSLIAGWPCVFYLIGWLPHYTFNYLDTNPFDGGTFDIQNGVFKVSAAYEGIGASLD